jgi:hypothetical protein
MCAAVKRPNVGAALEIESARRRARPIDYIAELQADNDTLRDEVEWLHTELCEMWLGLPF